MKICFVDEAGCTGELVNRNADIQPVFCIGAVVVDQNELVDLTSKYIELKRTFFPRKMNADQYMGNILKEVKGSDIRKRACDRSRNVRRHSIGYIDKLLKLLEEKHAAIFGRVWIKEIGTPINGRSIYTSSIQRICEYFQSYLELNDDVGIIVVDSRLKHLNSQVAHSIFTQKFKATGD
nr:DUF3800 domain-containing protein [Rhizobiaceae bacterium]